MFSKKERPAVTEEQVLAALRQIIDPDLRRDVVSLGMIKDLTIEGGRVSFTFELTTPACPVKAQFETMARQVVAAIPGVESVEVRMTANVPAARRPMATLPGVRHVIAVGAGKGGVGKTTVAVNLAVALAQLGARVGLLDADVHGPNVPLMMGVESPPRQEGTTILPAVSHGVRYMSAGFFVQSRQALIWRGPMVGKMVQELLSVVQWGELDYLVVDLPPGTGDAALSLAQAIPLTGALIVTQPPEVSLLDATKAVSMFQRLEVPILGIVENMSYFVCPHCGERTEIFARGGAREVAEHLNIPFLGELPLDPAIRAGGDAGVPVVVGQPDSPQAAAFRDLARAVAARVSVLSRAPEETGPGQRAFITFYDS